eukprot:TRINITY_DN1978_c0_g1_i1.p1 TRINITY_DN1978_c0_g1~~TRINITY_DN1978_c0_g1_i1.p1  ORF type:complete len:138 (-),score=2.46 TRINITY_DN1978_c0_g1_i1:175-588(-)
MMLCCDGHALKSLMKHMSGGLFFDRYASRSPRDGRGTNLTRAHRWRPDDLIDLARQQMRISTCCTPDQTETGAVDSNVENVDSNVEDTPTSSGAKVQAALHIIPQPYCFRSRAPKRNVPAQRMDLAASLLRWRMLPG